MALSDDQIKSLVEKIASVEAEPLDCDGCFEHLAEFAELALANREVPEALKAVEAHLRQCECCQAEFEALMDGLRALGDS
jgi:predicted anti-sigma-YlaC factor YlaD